MRTRALWGLIFIYSVLRFLWPGDIPFINDEALLIQRALEDNAHRVFTASGLMGSRGLDYGPFAIWFYRAILFWTHDLVLVAVAKMIFVYGLTVFSSARISKRLSFRLPIVLLLALSSPYLWFYSRDLWDNCFVIPLSAAFFAGYLEYEATKDYFALGVALLFLCFGFLTHLVFMPLVLAFAFHFLFFHFGEIRKNWPRVLVLALLSIMLVSPYLAHALKQHPTHQMDHGDVGHFIMPFTGPRFFTAMGLEYFLGETWKAPTSSVFLNGFWRLVTAISALAYPLFMLGLYRTARNPEWRKFSVFGFALLFQMLLSFFYRLIPIPNFHSAQWLVYFVFVLVAVESLKGKKWLVAPYLASLMLAIPAFLLLVHRDGGSRFIHYGPTLANQKAVAKTLAVVDAKEIFREAFHPAQFPFALETLKRLEEEPDETKRASAIRISYARPSNPQDGRLQAEVLP